MGSESKLKSNPGNRKVGRSRLAHHPVLPLGAHASDCDMGLRNEAQESMEAATSQRVQDDRWTPWMIALADSQLLSG
jgi:hypothetical protein